LLFREIARDYRGSCQGKAQMLRRVILHDEVGTGMYSHSREAGFIWLWWIHGEISATLTMVEVDKTTIQGPLHWGFNGWIFHSFTKLASSGL
jgi:hypothetical protein